VWNAQRCAKPLRQLHAGRGGVDVRGGRSAQGQHGQHDWDERYRKMSRAAHGAAVANVDNRSCPPPMTITMLDTIQDLLDGAPAPSLSSLEFTLTTGYAQALTLEGRRLRLERELRTLIRAPAPRTSRRAMAIAELNERIDEVDCELRRLRRSLATLRKHVA
jgi:hypothetical protein